MQRSAPAGRSACVPGRLWNANSPVRMRGRQSCLPSGHAHLGSSRRHAAQRPCWQECLRSGAAMEREQSCSHAGQTVLSALRARALGFKPTACSAASLLAGVPAFRGGFGTRTVLFACGADSTVCPPGTRTWVQADGMQRSVPAGRSACVPGRLWNANSPVRMRGRQSCLPSGHAIIDSCQQDAGRPPCRRAVLSSQRALNFSRPGERQ